LITRPTNYSTIGLIIPAMASAILKKLWATHRRNQANRRQARSRHPSFLSLPPEIRVTIYSYMISPSSASRSLRATCRQIKEELDHEDREAFTRRMTPLQLVNWKDPVQIHLLATTIHHHVNAVVVLPQLIRRAERQGVNFVFNEMYELLQSLPLNTRSITIVVKPYAQCKGRDFDFFYCAFTYRLYMYLRDLVDLARAGVTDLRELRILAADPIMLTLEVPRKGAWKRLPCTIKGLDFAIRTKRKGSMVKITCPTNEKYSRLNKEWMWYLRAKGQFRPRYQRGCVD
jgi:hypothetical protein